MTQRRPGNLIVHVLLLQLLVVGPLEYSHADFIAAPGSSNHSLSQHNCGSREMHKNLSDQHFCVPCYRSTTIVACLNLPPITPAAVKCSSSPSQSTNLRFQDSHLEIQKRGPPVSSLYA